jgi:hypothetical protein
VVRCERKHPGELIHLDIKKLGRFERAGHRVTGKRTGNASSRGGGCEFVHVCIDDASRLAFSQILPDEKKESSIAFLQAAIAYYVDLGVTVGRIMTDNSSGYRSRAFLSSVLIKVARGRARRASSTSIATPPSNADREGRRRSGGLSVAHPAQVP